MRWKTPLEDGVLLMERKNVMKGDESNEDFLAFDNA